jgi:hypothetical protein
VPNNSGSVASAPPPQRSRDLSTDGGVVRYGQRGFPIFGVQCPAGGWDPQPFSVGVAVVRDGPTHGSLGDPCTDDRSGKHRRETVQEKSSRLHRTTHPRSLVRNPKYHLSGTQPRGFQGFRSGVLGLMHQVSRSDAMIGPIAAHSKKLPLGFSAWRIQNGACRFSRDSSSEIDPVPERHTCPISVCKNNSTPNRIDRIYPVVEETALHSGSPEHGRDFAFRITSPSAQTCTRPHSRTDESTTDPYMHRSFRCKEPSPPPTVCKESLESATRSGSRVES